MDLKGLTHIMQPPIFSETTKAIIREVIREELESYFKANPMVRLNQPQYIIGVSALARFLHCGIDKIEKLISDESIPFYKTGRKYFFEASEVLEALKHNFKKGGRNAKNID